LDTAAERTPQAELLNPACGAKEIAQAMSDAVRETVFIASC